MQPGQPGAGKQDAMIIDGGHDVVGWTRGRVLLRGEATHRLAGPPRPGCPRATVTHSLTVTSGLTSGNRRIDLGRAMVPSLHFWHNPPKSPPPKLSANKGGIDKMFDLPAKRCLRIIHIHASTATGPLLAWNLSPAGSPTGQSLA